MALAAAFKRVLRYPDTAHDRIEPASNILGRRRAALIFCGHGRVPLGCQLGEYGQCVTDFADVEAGRIFAKFLGCWKPS